MELVTRYQQTAFGLLRVTAGYHRGTRTRLGARRRNRRGYRERAPTRISASISASRSSIVMDRMPLCRRCRWRRIRSAPGEILAGAESVLMLDPFARRSRIVSNGDQGPARGRKELAILLRCTSRGEGRTVTSAWEDRPTKRVASSRGIGRCRARVSRSNAASCVRPSSALSLCGREYGVILRAFFCALIPVFHQPIRTWPEHGPRLTRRNTLHQRHRSRSQQIELC